MLYIHDYDNWWKFRYDSLRVMNELGRVRSKQGMIIGRMLSLGFDSQDNAVLSNISMELVRSSEIEGEKLNLGEVRSSLARRLGIAMAGMVSASRYVEGVVDKLTTVSPLYANTDTEKAASQLVYPGLLSYDSANKLHGQLAHSWQHDDSGKVWTVKLRSDLKWADGQALTASDVVHTLALMKKPEINSAISSSWQTITATAKDTTTVEFTLPAPLMSFDSALTFGVLPKHILEGKSAIEIADLSNKQPG